MTDDPPAAAHRRQRRVHGRGVRPGRPGDPVGPGRRRPGALRQHRPAAGGRAVDPGRGAGLLAVVRAGSRRRDGAHARVRAHRHVGPRRGDRRTTTRRRVVYRLTSDEATSPHWPHPYAAELRARFGRALEVSLTTTNTGDEAFDYEEALHAYLVVGDVHRVRVDGPRRDVVLRQGDRHRAGAAGRPRVRRRDGCRVPHQRPGDPARPRPRAPAGRHAPRAPRNLVVWNPWAAKAAEVADIGDDDWERFVCIEGANAFENAVALAARGVAHDDLSSGGATAVSEMRSAGVGSATPRRVTR